MTIENKEMAGVESELFRDKIELSLDGRQVFYLFFGGAVLAAVVFVLGVTVGRRVEANSSVAAFDSATDPLAALDRLNADESDSLVFADALRGDGKELAALDFELSKGLKQGLERAESEQGKPKKKKKTQQPKPVGEKTAEPVSARAEKGEATAAADAEFTLQLSSFQNKSEANEFYKTLSSAGYQPYIVKADVSGRGTWFRVRLGQYSEYEDALAAKANFEEKQKMIAYVTRVAE